MGVSQALTVAGKPDLPVRFMAGLTEVGGLAAGPVTADTFGCHPCQLGHG